MEAIACRSAGATIPSVFASRLVTHERTQCSLRGASHFRLLRANRKSFTIVAAAKDNAEALQSLSNVVTDDAVPEGHKGLHGFLYGEGGAEVHGTAGGEFRGRENEDDGNAVLSFDSYVSPRESFKFAGVFAIYNAEEKLEYISYSRNVVSTLKSLRARVGGEKCSAVRVKMYTEAALITRAKLEEEKQRWLDSVGVPPGNGADKASWEGSGNAMSEQEKIEYEEKKLKMRKAMGENLFDDVAGEDDDARTRRLKLLQAVEGDDWSSVIDGQTKQTIDAPVAPKEEPVAEESVIVSPFASGSQTTGGLYSADTYEFTMENVDKVLDEVRPYLIADGGNVEVVSVKDGVVSLRLQGACGTCPSSTSTMKMGIERVLMEKFGDILKEVVQVDKQQIGATVAAIDAHLEMLRPAIRNYGGSVEVVSVDTEKGECQVKYQGPAPIGMGIQAAIKDKFPDVKQVDLLPVDSTEMDSTTKESKTSDASNNDLTTSDSIIEESTIMDPLIQDLASPDISQSEFGFQTPGLWSWLIVTLIAVFFITAAFLPSLLPPPVRTFCDAVGPPQLWQSFLYFVVFLHVLEASYALYLARELDPKNQALWFWQTFYVGFFSLTFLLRRKAKQ